MSAGPLHGLRVVELAAIGPVPLAAMIMSDLGAEVIRVDRIAVTKRPADKNRHSYLRGRTSIAVDLSETDGTEVVLRLVATADVLLEGFRPGVMERLGLGPEVCIGNSPKLVYGRMTGWGQTGPLAHVAGHDINFIALAGVLNHLGTVDKPIVPLNLVGDYGGGSMLLLAGVLAAVLAVQRGGGGQVVDAAMVDGASLLMTPTHDMLARGEWNLGREDNVLDGAAPFYSTYATADDRYVALGAIEPKFYAVFLSRAGLDAAALPSQYDRAQWPALRARLAELFRQKTMAQWEAVFEGSDACVTPVLSMAEAANHQHAVARASFVDAGPHGRQPAPAPRYSQTPAKPGREYLAGSGTREVLAELGYSSTEAESLLGSGTVA
jgi:alpha-methylacyl-CoA racemase